MDVHKLFDTLKTLGQIAGQVLLGGVLASGGFLLSIFAPVVIHLVPNLGAPAPHKLTSKERPALRKPKPDFTSEKSRSDVRSPSPDRRARVTFPSDLPSPLRLDIPKPGKPQNKSPYPTTRRAPRPAALSLPLPSFQVELTASPEEVPEGETPFIPDQDVTRESSSNPNVLPKHLSPMNGRRPVWRSCSTPLPKLKKRPASPLSRPAPEGGELEPSSSSPSLPVACDCEASGRCKAHSPNRRKSRPTPPVARTQPYAAPYFFPSPGSAEAEDYVRLVREERRRGPRRTASMELTLSAPLSMAAGAAHEDVSSLETSSSLNQLKTAKERLSIGSASESAERQPSPPPLLPSVPASATSASSPARRPLFKRLGKSDWT